MTIGMEAGWLSTLAALWNADGLEAWAAKLVGVLVAVLALTALFSLGAPKGAGRAPAPPKPPRVKTAQTVRARTPGRAAPPKNLKKKRERIVRRYRPRSHSGTLRPLTRRVALKLVETPPRTAPVQPVLRRTAR